MWSGLDNQREHSKARQGKAHPDSDTLGSDGRSKSSVVFLTQAGRDLTDTCNLTAVQLQLRDYPSPVLALVQQLLLLYVRNPG